MSNPNVIPVKQQGIWRIRRWDGDLVGAYATKQLAQRAIDNQPWLHFEQQLWNAIEKAESSSVERFE